MYCITRPHSAQKPRFNEVRGVVLARPGLLGAAPPPRGRGGGIPPQHLLAHAMMRMAGRMPMSRIPQPGFYGQNPFQRREAPGYPAMMMPQMAFTQEMNPGAEAEMMSMIPAAIGSPEQDSGEFGLFFIQLI